MHLILPLEAIRGVYSGTWRAHMLTGAHIVIYSKDAQANRKFFGDTLGLRSVDAGEGWLIFALPAAEVAFHPHDKNNQHEMYFVCDNLKAQMAALRKKGVRFGEIAEERWGIRTTMLLPDGGEIGLYEPKHPVTFQKASKGRRRGKAKRSSRS
jgi:catechol 2,3-dioxygenase-like lactoylglutathione lyase family enzyme